MTNFTFTQILLTSFLAGLFACLFQNFLKLCIHGGKAGVGVEQVCHKSHIEFGISSHNILKSHEVKTTINPVDELFVANRIKYFHKPIQCCSLGWNKSTLGNISTSISTSYCIFNLRIPLKASRLALKKTHHDNKPVLFQKISFLSVPLKFYLSR